MSVASDYESMFTAYGRLVTLERVQPNAAPIVVAGVRARVRGATVEEVSSGIKATERRVLLLAADIPASFLPVRQGDWIQIDGANLVFDARPDDQTHRDGDLLLAIDGFATGG